MCPFFISCETVLEELLFDGQKRGRILPIGGGIGVEKFLEQFGGEGTPDNKEKDQRGSIRPNSNIMAIMIW